jgi:hypothetical protein
VLHFRGVLKIEKEESQMKYREIIAKMTLEEKASLMSGKDFWQTQNIDRLGINSMLLADTAKSWNINEI